MDMTPYDPVEVARLQARPGCHGARMRFAIHVERRCPTHVWPYILFAKHAVDDDERLSYLEAAIRAGTAQLEAEREGRATRHRDPGEDRFFRMALRVCASMSAAQGYPREAAHAVAKLLEFFPEDGASALEKAQAMGVIPAQAAETAATMRM